MPRSTGSCRAEDCSADLDVSISARDGVLWISWRGYHSELFGIQNLRGRSATMLERTRSSPAAWRTIGLEARDKDPRFEGEREASEQMILRLGSTSEMGEKPELQYILG